MKRRVFDILARAKIELDKATQELALSDSEDSETGKGKDLVEVRARVDALEARVAAIEQRGGT